MFMHIICISSLGKHILFLSVRRARPAHPASPSRFYNFPEKIQEISVKFPGMSGSFPGFVWEMSGTFPEKNPREVLETSRKFPGKFNEISDKLSSFLIVPISNCHELTCGRDPTDQTQTRPERDLDIISTQLRTRPGRDAVETRTRP